MKTKRHRSDINLRLTRYSAIAAAAARWLEAAGPAGEGASFAFSDRERRDWHFTPRGREGLMIGDMSRAQREATTALMRTTLSSPGVLKAQDIMRLEAVLAEVEGSSLRYRNPEGYYVSVFGDPNGYPWGWRLEGHHLSINVTVAAPNEAFVTPLFTGTNPAVPPSDSGFAKVIQQDEMTLALRLIQSLEPEQAAARLSLTGASVVSTLYPRRSSGSPEVSNSRVARSSESQTRSRTSGFRFSIEERRPNRRR